MSNQVFDANISYVDRFMASHSKRVKFPSFRYLDAKLHPKYKDQVVVLSSNEFPTGMKMTNAFETNSSFDVDRLDSLPSTKEYFVEAIEAIETEKKIKLDKELEESQQEVHQKNQVDTFGSHFMPSASESILKKGQELGFNQNSNEDELEGGESDKDDSQPEDPFKNIPKQVKV